MEPVLHYIRKIATGAISLLLAGVLVAGCSGVETGSSADSGSGNVVRVAISSAPALPASGPSANAPVTEAAAGSASQNIDNVWITVTKVALLPGAGSGQPDPNGETPVEDSGAAEAGLQVAELAQPKTIDLLHLPGSDIAMFLNAFDNVPAGTYGKIRLYYIDPKVYFHGDPGSTDAHPTANYHLDIHFVGGDLVIPVSTNPAGGVRFFNVVIRIVLGKDGLKVTVNPNKILIRPQVFADFDPPVAYEISGTAAQVLGGNTFDLLTADLRTFHAAFNDNTGWSFQDGPSGNRVGVTPAQGRAALDNGSSAIVIGSFTSPDTISADNIVVILPDKITGTVVSGTPSDGWLADNTFKVMRDGTADNIVVFPMPDRAGAFYVNLVAGRAPSSDNVVSGDNVVVIGKFRNATEFSGFWITIGP